MSVDFPFVFEPTRRCTEIHKAPCKNCPSAHYPPDPEAEEYKALPQELHVRHVFACAWRPEKMCKGVCDYMGVSEEEVRAFAEVEPWL